MVTAIPSYLLISTGTVAVAFIGLGLLEISVITASAGGAVIALELLPAEVRFTGIAIPYNTSAALFAGTAPLISQLLVEWTGYRIAPAIYATLAAVIAFPVILRGMPETGTRSIRPASLSPAGRVPDQPNPTR